MNKLLYFTCVVLISTTSYSGCLSENIICPEQTKTCPKNTFMGDDGICYDCYSDKTVTIHCMGHDEVFERCPNRYTDISGCGSPQSGLTCLNKGKEEINKLERKLTSRFFGKWEEDKNFINFNNHTCQNDWGVKY